MKRIKRSETPDLAKVRGGYFFPYPTLTSAQLAQASGGSDQQRRLGELPPGDK